jgi:hypothetical protein
MATIHPANTMAWAVGDYVIHDADAKRADMLMVVTGRSRAGVYRTRYAFPETLPRSWQRKVWRNTVESLHDPRRFGIETPVTAIKSEALASTERRPPTSTPAPGPTAKS